MDRSFDYVSLGTDEREFLPENSSGVSEEDRKKSADGFVNPWVLYGDGETEPGVPEGTGKMLKSEAKLTHEKIISWINEIEEKEHEPTILNLNNVDEIEEEFDLRVKDIAYMVNLLKIRGFVDVVSDQNNNLIISRNSKPREIKELRRLAQQENRRWNKILKSM